MKDKSIGSNNNFCFKLLSLSVGRVIRLFQRLMIPPKLMSKDVLDIIDFKVLNDSADFAIINFTEAMPFRHHRDLWQYCINKAISLKNVEIVLEFGVYKGESINYFAKKLPHAQIFGFDSFEGLQEDWLGTRSQKGAYNAFGIVPKAEKNVTFYKGWFEDTVPGFLKQLGGQQIDILHIDSDTYTPAIFVLKAFLDNLSKDTIIIFDEYYGYNNWRNHEFKAWQEFISIGKKYKYIAYTGTRVAVQLL